MALRFRKRIKVFPGFHVNLSGSGISSTIGVKGASINFSKKGTYLNTGIPGTGLYSRERIGGMSASPAFAPLEYETLVAPTQETEGAIISADTQEMTSSSMVEMKETLLEAYKERHVLKGEVSKARTHLLLARLAYILSCILIFGFFVKGIKEWAKEKNEYLKDLQAQLQNCFVDIDIHFDSSV